MTINVPSSIEKAFIIIIAVSDYKAYLSCCVAKIYTRYLKVNTKKWNNKKKKSIQDSWGCCNGKFNMLKYNPMQYISFLQ